jgi:hypothetical protein
MASNLIRLSDGLLVEVEAEDGAPQHISSRHAESVQVALDQAHDLILQAVKPVASVWSELNRDLTIDEVEINLALGFSAEGNLFIARGTTSANLGFKLKVKPAKESADPPDQD